MITRKDNVLIVTGKVNDSDIAMALDSADDKIDRIEMTEEALKSLRRWRSGVQADWFGTTAPIPTSSFNIPIVLTKGEEKMNETKQMNVKEITDKLNRLMVDLNSSKATDLENKYLRGCIIQIRDSLPVETIDQDQLGLLDMMEEKPKAEVTNHISENCGANCNCASASREERFKKSMQWTELLLSPDATQATADEFWEYLQRNHLGLKKDSET